MFSSEKWSNVTSLRPSTRRQKRNLWKLRMQMTGFLVDVFTAFVRKFLSVIRIKSNCSRKKRTQLNCLGSLFDFHSFRDELSLLPREIFSSTRPFSRILFNPH